MLVPRPQAHPTELCLARSVSTGHVIAAATLLNCSVAFRATLEGRVPLVSHSGNHGNNSHPPTCHTYLGIDVEPICRFPFIITLLQPLCEEVACDGLVGVSLTSKAEKERSHDHCKCVHACVCVCVYHQVRAYQKSLPQWQCTPCSSLSVAMTALPHPGEGHHLSVRLACTKLFVIKYRYLPLTDAS